jgi:phytoene desaturase
MKIIIIGAGFAGLSAGISLATKGHEVHIYEKESEVGGKAKELKVGSCRFDVGPSLLTMPEVFEELFTRANKTFSKEVPYTSLDVVCKYFFSNGKQICICSDENKSQKELEKIGVTKKEFNAFRTYTQNIYTVAKRPFLEQPLKEKAIHDPKNKSLLSQVFNLDPFRTMYSRIKKSFSSTDAQQLFMRYATYTGSDPYQAPATLNVINHVERMGAYYPNKGIRSIISGMHKLAKEVGVQIHTNSPITAINHDATTKYITSVSVKDNKKPITCDALISAVDTRHTYKLLTIKKRMPQASSSALVFMWDVKGNHQNLDIHNILFSANYKEEFNHLFRKKAAYHDPTVYIHITSKYKSSDAAKNHENWFVMINAPATDKQLDTKTIKQHIIENIYKHTGIQPEILAEKILQPVDIAARDNSYLGSIYGTSSNSLMASFLRQQNSSTKHPNLFFCGGTTHPGGGMSLSARSGMFAADLCMEQEVKKATGSTGDKK